MRVKKVNVKMRVRMRMRTWVTVVTTAMVTAVASVMATTAVAHAATARQRQIRHHKGAKYERQQNRENDSIFENSFDHPENLPGATRAK